MPQPGNTERPWSRTQDVLAPDFDSLDRFLDGLLKGERLASFEVLSGGRANTNLRLVCRGSTPDLVLRLYQRDPAQREKEVAIADLLWGRLPVPDVVVHGADAPVLRMPYVLMKYVEGEAIEKQFGALDADGRAALGHALGTTLATLHANTYETPGFLDDELRVATPLPSGGAGMVSALDHLVAEGAAMERLGAERCGTMTAHLRQRAARLDAWPRSASLVHGDFGFSNILMTGEGRDATVAAVLDWEFALAATPLLDLGNLIRPPGGEDATFLDAVAGGYRSIDATLPDDWIDLARAVDLLAWADFAARPDAPDDLLDHARTMIDGITGTEAP